MSPTPVGPSDPTGPTGGSLYPLTHLALLPGQPPSYCFGRLTPISLRSHRETIAHSLDLARPDLPRSANVLQVRARRRKRQDCLLPRGRTATHRGTSAPGRFTGPRAAAASGARPRGRRLHGPLPFPPGAHSERLRGLGASTSNLWSNLHPVFRGGRAVPSDSARGRPSGPLLRRRPLVGLP